MRKHVARRSSGWPWLMPGTMRAVGSRPARSFVQASLQIVGRRRPIRCVARLASCASGRSSRRKTHDRYLEYPTGAMSYSSSTPPSPTRLPPSRRSPRCSSRTGGGESSGTSSSRPSATRRARADPLVARAHWLVVRRAPPSVRQCGGSFQQAFPTRVTPVASIRRPRRVRQAPFGGPHNPALSRPDHDSGSNMISRTCRLLGRLVLVPQSCHSQRYRSPEATPCLSEAVIAAR